MILCIRLCPTLCHPHARSLREDLWRALGHDDVALHDTLPFEPPAPASPAAPGQVELASC
jgi:hypothetical protein